MLLGINVQARCQWKWHILLYDPHPWRGISSLRAWKGGAFRPFHGEDSMKGPSLLTLVSAGLFISYILTPFSAEVAVVWQLFPFLKYVIPEVLSPSLISTLTSGGSVLELAGIGSIGQGKLLAASNKSHPFRPSTHTHLAMQTRYIQPHEFLRPELRMTSCDVLLRRMRKLVTTQ